MHRIIKNLTKKRLQPRLNEKIKKREISQVRKEKIAHIENLVESAGITYFDGLCGLLNEFHPDVFNLLISQGMDVSLLASSLNVPPRAVDQSKAAYNVMIYDNYIAALLKDESYGHTPERIIEVED